MGELKSVGMVGDEAGGFSNGLKSVGIIWGEATPLYRRIKIRGYGMG